jgi:hypothetical protein
MLVVNNYNLVTRTCYELATLYNNILDLDVHAFNKDPISYIILVHGGIV